MTTSGRLIRSTILGIACLALTGAAMASPPPGQVGGPANPGPPPTVHPGDHVEDHTESRPLRHLDWIRTTGSSRKPTSTTDIPSS